MIQPRRFDPAVALQMQAALEAAVAEGHMPGAVVQVGWLEPQATRAASVRDAVFDADPTFGTQTWVAGQLALQPQTEPLGADAVYDVASLTKAVITAPLLARLFELRLAQPDAAVASVLPGFAHPMITLRHLLTHTSGLPAGLGLDEPWQGPDGALARACASHPSHSPGTFFRYSDVNFILLGAVAQRLTGQPLDALADEVLLRPLGLRDTGYRPLEAPGRWADVPRHRIAPTEWEGPIGAAREARPPGAAMLRGIVHDPTARRMGGVAGHAGLFSTAADIGRLARMLLRGGEIDGVRVLQPDSVSRMLAVATPPNLPERRSLGWDIDTPLSRARGLPGQGWSAGSAGHTGFTGCALWLDPARGAYHVLLSNRVHPVARQSIVALYEQVATLAAQGVDRLQ